MEDRKQMRVNKYLIVNFRQTVQADVMGDAGTSTVRSGEQVKCGGDGEETNKSMMTRTYRNTRQENRTGTPTRRTSNNDLTRMIKQRIYIKILLRHHPDLESFSFTFPDSEMINIDWTRLYQIIHQRDSEAFLSFLYSFSNLEEMVMRVKYLTETWSDRILQLTQNFPSLTKLTVRALLLLEDGLEILRRSNTRPGCVVTLNGSICNKPSQKCTSYYDCWSHYNQHVRILLNYQGFSMETLEALSFWD